MPAKTNSEPHFQYILECKNVNFNEHRSHESLTGICKHTNGLQQTS